MRFAYNSLLAAGAAASLPYWLVKVALVPKYRAGLAQRFFGLGPGAVGDARAAGRAGPVWVHAVSAGEAAAAKPIVDALRQRRGDWPFFFTTVTQVGQKIAAERLFADVPVAYFPLDLPWAVGRSLSAVSPRAFIALEKEIWPNFFWELASRGIPSAVVNGRLTEGSFRRNMRARALFRRVLPCVSLFAMQAEGDAERVIRLGAPPDRVHVTGNTKVDQVPSEVPGEVLARLRGELDLPEGVRVWVAGSTHKGEEKAAVLAHMRLVRELPGAVAIIAPRHMERLAQIEAELSELGVRWQRRTALAGRRDSDVIILDTVGELQSVYALADVAFVGGTLAPVGGHNPLEPAALGVPVLVGPHTDKCAEARAMLEGAGGLRVVPDEGALAEALVCWMCDEVARRSAGRAAREAVEANRGATERTVDLLLPLIEKGEVA